MEEDNNRKKTELKTGRTRIHGMKILTSPRKKVYFFLLSLLSIFFNISHTTFR